MIVQKQVTMDSSPISSPNEPGNAGESSGSTQEVIRREMWKMCTEIWKKCTLKCEKCALDFLVYFSSGMWKVCKYSVFTYTMVLYGGHLGIEGYFFYFKTKT